MKPFDLPLLARRDNGTYWCERHKFFGKAMIIRAGKRNVAVCEECIIRQIDWDKDLSEATETEPAGAETLLTPTGKVVMLPAGGVG